MAFPHPTFFINCSWWKQWWEEVWETGLIGTLIRQGGVSGQEACVTMHDEPCIQRNDITIYRCVGRMLIQHISINYYIAGNLHPQYINIAARLYSWTLDYMVIAIATDPWLLRSLLNGLGKETMATNYSIFSQTRMVMLLPTKQHS